MSQTVSKHDHLAIGQIILTSILLAGSLFAFRFFLFSSRLSNEYLHWHVNCYLFRGPDDNGLAVDGPGRLTKKAFENGALYVNTLVECIRWNTS
jgi:hypothetical protein